MRRVTVIVALGLLAAIPACAQPYHGYRTTPAYPVYGPAPYPYAAAPRYWGGGGHHHHHAAPRHHHRPHHYHGGHRHHGGHHRGGHRH